MIGPFLALLGFMAGAAVGGNALQTAAKAWAARTTIMPGIVAVAGIVTLAVTVVGALLSRTSSEA